MGLITIESTEIPSPSTYDVGIYDIVGTETRRNANGKLIADKIADKIEINLEWKYLTNAQYVAILGAITNFFFNVTYHDPRTGTTDTKVFYIGDRTSGIFKYNADTDTITGWKNVKFKFVEQ